MRKYLVVQDIEIAGYSRPTGLYFGSEPKLDQYLGLGGWISIKTAPEAVKMVAMEYRKKFQEMGLL